MAGGSNSSPPQGGCRRVTDRNKVLRIRRYRGGMDAVCAMHASPFGMLRNDATGCCDGLSPDAMRASLQESPTAAEQTRMTTMAATRIAQACPSTVRDGCVAGAQGDRIAPVILRLPDGVQNRSSCVCPPGDSAEQSSRQRRVEAVQALTYLDDCRNAPNRSSESYSGTTSPVTHVLR